MDDQAKANYDDKLINDKDYYKLKFGRFTLSLKFIFLVSLGSFLIALAASENTKSDSDCPTNYKIKKLKLDVQHSEEKKEEIAISWMKKQKVGKESKISNSAPRKKHIYSLDVGNKTENEDSEAIVLPSDKSILKKINSE